MIIYPTIIKITTRIIIINGLEILNLVFPFVYGDSFLLPNPFFSFFSSFIKSTGILEVISNKY